MNRPGVTIGVLALVLLAVGALSATFADRVAGQSAPTEASATPEAEAPPVSSAAPQAVSSVSAPSDGGGLEPLATGIGNTGCQKNAGNPHIAQRPYDPRRAKGFGGIIRCDAKKDYLWARVDLYKKGNNGDTTWSLADQSFTDCYTCYSTNIGAVRRCGNRKDNLFQTTVNVYVKNNGNNTDGYGESRVVTLDCGGF